MVNLGHSTINEVININNSSTEISLLIKRLETIADKLYTVNEFEIELLKGKEE